MRAANNPAAHSLMSILKIIRVAGRRRVNETLGAYTSM